ncbi:hypothetical protein [Anatilimnocola aggregata]|nr:hypothetical protein [Anatilimnocola aggregata]
MDLRLLDETVRWMELQKLTNAYDHAIMAGASLGALGGPEGPISPATGFESWHKTFLKHLELAHKLHHIKQVYVLEHRDCGAYKEFLGAEGAFDPSEAQSEVWCHTFFARRLRAVIEAWSSANKGPNEEILIVKSFIMGLDGNVSPLEA